MFAVDMREREARSRLGARTVDASSSDHHPARGSSNLKISHRSAPATKTHGGRRESRIISYGKQQKGGLGEGDSCTTCVCRSPVLEQLLEICPE